MSASNAESRILVPLDEGWRFYPGDCERAWEPSWDDRSWESVRLPHDYLIKNACDPRPQEGVNPDWYVFHGHIPIHPAWYRLDFRIPVGSEGRRVYLECDGIFSRSRLWLNGRELGQNHSGYTGFYFDITNFMEEGSNLLAIRVDPEYDGWWYEGGGIYRPVRLILVEPCHFSLWGSHGAAFPELTPDGTALSARVRIRSGIMGLPWGGAGTGALKTGLRVEHEILDAAGQTVARDAFDISAGDLGDVDKGSPTDEAVLERNLALDSPRLWSVEEPYLYRLRSTLVMDGREIDRVSLDFGVRSVHFDPDGGFFLNRRHVLLKGVNAHQDHAGLGIAVPEGVIAWRLRRLKELGANALRLSHNPVTPMILDLCDRLGLLVIAENRHLGDTYADQSPPDTPAREHKDLSALVRRDRNHPCIILWSLCNEQWIQGMPESAAIAAAMKRRVKELDPDRLVTAALNGGFDCDDGLASVLDVIGVNYNPEVYDGLHRRFPGKPILASEIASEVATRGCYDLEAWDQYRGKRESGHLAAYSVNTAGCQIAEAAWPPVVERSFLAGGFVWAGFDYRGEPRPFTWPCVGSHYGLMDSCGFPKDGYHYYRAWWNQEPVLHLFPHWNWPGREGESIPVWVHCNGQEVELFLNGRSLGSKKVEPLHHLEWQVPYEPGILLARAKHGEGLLEARVETTGPAAKVQLDLQGPVEAGWGGPIALVRIAIVDDQGRLVPDGDVRVSLEARGPAVLLGTGNGDPSCHDPVCSPWVRTFHGLAQAVFRLDGSPDGVEIQARAAGLETGSLTLPGRQGLAHPQGGHS